MIIGHDSNHTASVTRGAISDIAGDTTARTGDAEVGLKPIFDLNKVQKEISAQVKITQTLSQQAGQEIASYAEKQRAPLQQQLKEAGTEEERKAIQEQINKLSMQERALNVLLGAVTGMGGAALTRETLQGAADTLRQMAVADSCTFAGVTDGVTTLTNVSGNSEGVRGDGVKLGGTRVDLDQVCGKDNERCAVKRDGNGIPVLDAQGNTQLELNKNGLVVFTPEAVNDLSLEQYLKSPEGKKMPGLTGGIQGYLACFAILAKSQDLNEP